MKKLFALLAILISTTCFSQIATKSLGIDSVTGLNLRIKVWQLTIDDSAKVITVVYNVQRLSPSGVPCFDYQTQTYTRFNQPVTIKGTDTIPANNRYADLEASPLGQGIVADIVNDLRVLTTIKDLPKLQQ